MLAFLTPSKPYVRDNDASISVPVADESEQKRVAELEQAVERQVKRLQEELTEPARPPSIAASPN